ncbi:MAG: alpha/beta fold hydrolase, partial [Gammaproteobacteria bacterium]
MHAAGFRTVAPYLRGFGPTRFRLPETPRDGRGVALAHDALALMEVLGITRFAVVGHDRGARTAYTLAALFPDRVVAAAALWLAYQPGGSVHHAVVRAVPPLLVPVVPVRRRGCGGGSRRPAGRRPPAVGHLESGGLVRRRRVRRDGAQLRESRLGRRHAPRLPRTLAAGAIRPALRRLEKRLRTAGTITVPTLMIQGGDDRCDARSTSEGQARWFSGPYHRVVLDAVGHFPAREAPDA